MDGHLDLVAVTSQVFINRVVQHLEHAMMQTPLVGVTDIHARPLANRLQTFQFVDLRRIVFLRRFRTGFWIVGCIQNVFFRHKKAAAVGDEPP